MWFLENKNENKTAVGEIRVPEYSSNQNIQADTQDQSIWGNCSDGNIIRSKYLQNSKAKKKFLFFFEWGGGSSV